MKFSEWLNQQTYDDQPLNVVLQNTPVDKRWRVLRDILPDLLTELAWDDPAEQLPAFVSMLMNTYKDDLTTYLTTVGLPPINKHISERSDILTVIKPVLLDPVYQGGDISFIFVMHSDKHGRLVFQRFGGLLGKNLLDACIEQLKRIYPNYQWVIDERRSFSDIIVDFYLNEQSQ